MPAVVLCNEGGAALAELDPQKKQPVKATGYVLWEGFDSARQELLMAEMAYAPIHGSVPWHLAHPVVVALDLAADPGRGSEALAGWNPAERAW
ncbi:MAG TPA: hypothetical protein VGV93_13905 [Acidimicrobiales bacterium]|nr:hypothetical protein [Acidimicrobiales bacterium]